MKYKETNISSGGLMRCCLETLYDFIKNHSEETAIDGFILDCAYAKPGNSEMILRGGTWKWNNE